MRISFVSNSLNIQNKNSLNKPQTTFVASKRENSFRQVSFMGQDLVSNSVKNSLNDMSKYPKDIEYRKELMKNAGLNPKEFYRIRSIIGSQEIEDMMKTFNDSEVHYSSGVDYSNVLAGKMRANLHIHTVASDGAMTPEELLEKASFYANNVVNKNSEAKDMPFVIAVTDHDTTDSAKEVIKLVSENPEKYKNLRVILGVEMTTYNNIALDITKEPVNTHVLVYGIDPNEQCFKTFIDSTKEKKFCIQQKMIDRANMLYEKEYGKEDFFSVEQAKDYFPPLNKGLLGIYNYVSTYVKTKHNIENVVLKDDKFKKILEDNNLPATTNSLLRDLKAFYYPLTYNNKAVKLEEALPKYLSKKTNNDEDSLKKLYIDALNNSDRSFEHKLNDEFVEFKRTAEPKYDYVPDFKGLYDALKNQDGAMIGLAHPLEPIKKMKNIEDRFVFLNEFYSNFKENCKEKAKFSEVYYQSYPADTRDFQLDGRTVEFFDEISKQYDLYKTGSQDTHRTNIFKRYY